MIRNLNKTNMAAEDVESIGNGFAKKYYDALVGKPNASALRHFYNAQSKYVHVQTGRPDCEMDGLYLIGRFLRQMEYRKCTVAILSVATVRRENQAEFLVTSVCEISRPETIVARSFTQTSVIKRVAWTTSDFQIARTELKYNDDIVDFSVPIAVGDKPEVSSAISTDISGKCVKPVVDSDKKATRKQKVIRAPVDRCGKVNGLGKKPMTTSMTAGALVRHGIVRGESCPLRTENKHIHGTAMVLDKNDTGKPTVTMPRPVAKTAVKDESGKPKAPRTVNKTVGNLGGKYSKEVQRTSSIRPVLGGQIPFVSTNRFGYLAEMDPDCPSDVQVDNLHHRKIEFLVPTASEKDNQIKTEGRSKKCRRNRKKRGCKGNNATIVTPKGSGEVEVTDPQNSYIRQLRHGLAFVKEFVLQMFFNLTFNPLN